MAKRPTPRRQWEPLRRGSVLRNPDRDALAAAAGMPADPEVWLNDRYQVVVTRDEESGNVIELSIRRLDRKPARDWRDFQRIKDQLAGPDVEAVELYPARERVVDTANQYFLWCLPPGTRLPIGFPVGMVLDHGEVGVFDVPNAVQRPIDPADRAPGGTLSRGAK